MSIRTTVTLDDDVVERLKEESRSRGVPFRALLNEAVRSGLLAMKSRVSSRPFKIKPINLGASQGLNYDGLGALLGVAEGENWR
jgi:hypothetical protein